MNSRRERRVSELYHTPPPAPHRILTYGDPPVEASSAERSLRIEVMLLKQDVAQAHQDLERAIAQTHLAIAQRDIAVAAKNIVEEKLQDLNQVVEKTTRHMDQLIETTNHHTDQLSALGKANNTTHTMLQQILEIVGKPASSTDHRWQTPSLIDLDETKSQTPSLIDVGDTKSSTNSMFGDLIDLAGWADTIPSIDTSGSKSGSHGTEFFDVVTLPESPSEVIRRFSTEVTLSDTPTVREETDLKCPELGHKSVEASVPSCTVEGVNGTHCEETDSTEVVGHTQSHLYTQSTTPSRPRHPHQQLIASDAPSEAPAISCPRHDQSSTPWLCTLSYHPSPPATNTYKTLLLSNLHQEVEVSEILSKVRGGTVIYCRLLPTTPITGSLSALLRFLNEGEARAYDDFCHAHPVLIKNKKLETSLVRSPSWPLSYDLEYMITQAGRTRCIFIAGFNDKIPPGTMRKILRRPYEEEDATGQVDMELFKERGLEIRFASIEYAIYARDKLRAHRGFEKYQVTFVKDPCSAYLVTLLEKKDAVGKEEHVGLPCLEPASPAVLHALGPSVAFPSEEEASMVG